MARLLEEAPQELTADRLHRLGEGIGKVVYASEHWVVKRERSPTEVIALILLWKFLRRWAHRMPFGWGNRLLSRPSKVLHAMRVGTEALMLLIPKSIWYTTHVSEVLRTYVKRNRRGDKLAREHLAGTDLVPETVTFPTATVLVSGWPGWLVVREATERVEATLDARINALAEAGDFAAVEQWLDRFLETRRSGWQTGLFSTDAHLKNYGIIGDRVVLLDTGGLTNRWSDIAEKLENDEAIEEPHVKLGLGKTLAAAPEVAERFNERWKSLVNRETVTEHWPAEL